MYTLSAGKQHAVAPTLRVGGREQGAGSSYDNTPVVADTVRSHPRPGSNSVGNIAIFNMRGREGGAMPEEAEAASLRSASGGSSRSYVAFNNRQDPTPSGEVTNPLGAKDNGGGVAFSINSRREGRLREVHGSLHTGSGTQVDGVIDHGVRRLTPRECERLQGFPDDWTRYGHDGTEMADTPRYRMLGNAVAVPVAEWIGRRILASC